MKASEYKSLSADEKRTVDSGLQEIECTINNMDGFRAILNSFGVPISLTNQGQACNFGEQSISGRGLVRVWTNGETSLYDLLFHAKDDIYIRPVLLRHESMFEVAKQLSELLEY
jgi:hypothetical protein